MEFREQLLDDLDSVFFNQEEFASSHTINGAEVTMIIDNDTLADLYISKDTETDRLFTDSVLVNVPESELDFEPVPGQFVDFDGQGYLITDVKLDGGMYTMVMGVNGH